ncbi:hypothetical protein SLS62_003920 [Diatrype stigma]|uniref:Uncharacterized protein n=1 Tax=Diatrype stigma TaxID=117547 RepID=A0AAN9URM0_9PEZI
MSTTEEQELMAKIGNLAGKINRHKAQQYSPSFDPQHPSRAPSSYHRPAPYPSAGYRGPARNRYRNKTLVLNGQPGSSQSVDASAAANPSNPSWVAKTDRHMQLINSAVYEKEAQSRSNAIEQTHRHRQLQKDNREKAKFVNYARQHAINATAPPSVPGSGPVPRFEITVDGIPFQVLKAGNKLVKLPGDVNPPNATPKEAFVGGVKFHRTRNGNLVRHGIVKAQQLAGGVKKVNEQCKAFSLLPERPQLSVYPRRFQGVYLQKDALEGNTGVCKVKGCKRPHIERASVLRRFGNRSSPEEMGDISSDDDFAADSDDIDSDGVEEFIEGDEVEDRRFSEQTDFIGF